MKHTLDSTYFAYITPLVYHIHDITLIVYDIGFIADQIGFNLTSKEKRATVYFLGELLKFIFNSWKLLPGIRSV